MQASLIHMQVSDSMEENLKTAEQMIYNAAEAGSKFICLPEYFSIPYSLENQKSVDRVFNETYEPTLLFLKQISKSVDAYVVGGTLVEKFRGSFTIHAFYLKMEKCLENIERCILRGGRKL